ncbi:MAG: LamG domain-containing protein [Bacteroidales bacterium]|nr:LamG domain-containing protein [Bacteroidales bacterium]HOI31858.1 LamG domain-containing protein [Bacteroidales bacterium]
MKKFKPFSMMMILMISLVAITIAGCKKDDDDEKVTVDKTALQAKITVAETMLNDAVEGTADGQYQYGSKAVFETKINLAKTVNANEEVTQVQVDAAVLALDQAITEFESKKVTPIAPEALVGHWTFDEGSGTTVNDYSGKNFNGTLKTGHEFFGAGFPEWATDRYGNETKALYFNQGANVEIPYNAQLNPQEITISLWMKPDVLEVPWANNYMVSMKRWDGYKLQLQDAPKVFFTVKALNAGEEVWHDRDNESPTIDMGEWYHVAVSFKNNEMAFYLDGTLVKLWDNTPGTAVTLAEPMNLIFGQDLPTNIYTGPDGDYNVEWGGYFKGILDEVRIFNTALTSAQIESIYNLEKP